MNDASPFGSFLQNQTAQVSLPLFFLNLVLAAVLAWLLGRAYVRFGGAFSDRAQFARNFTLMAATTMLIITIVKSSLALSLGLVGALSIIRFRAAIKEPEELSYLFIAIAVGVGLGAGQTLITVGAFLVILALIAVRHWRRGSGAAPNYYVTVTCPSPKTVGLPRILETLKAHATAAALKRFDQTPEAIEASFDAQFADAVKLDACTQQLRSLGDGVRVSYLEQNGLGV
jgi:uncharacterized membrane protein YhiD involved in acid resistance